MTMLSIVRAATDYSFKEIIMLTTFSMYAYVSIVMSGAIVFAALKTTKDDANEPVAIQVEDDSAEPDRLTASSNNAE